MTTELIPFEQYARENGSRYWRSIDFMGMLGYRSHTTFLNVIAKAMSSCISSGIQPHDSFRHDSFEVDGSKINGYRLSRFACYLVALHADVKKPEVAAARVFFAQLAEVVADRHQADADVARIDLRSEVTKGEKLMTSAAASAGLTSGKMMAIFKDSGFRGMYNMGIRDLKVRRGVKDKETLYDYMGQTELAGNYFRITQSAEVIKQSGTRNEQAVMNAAKKVGKEIRAMMIRNSGVAPEHLKKEEHVKESKKRLKAANRGLKKLDAPKKPKAKAKRKPKSED